VSFLVGGHIGTSPSRHRKDVVEEALTFLIGGSNPWIDSNHRFPLKIPCSLPDPSLLVPCSEIAPIPLHVAKSECRCGFSTDASELNEKN
jgi:hypothetical protein